MKCQQSWLLYSRVHLYYVWGKHFSTTVVSQVSSAHVLHFKGSMYSSFYTMYWSYIPAFPGKAPMQAKNLCSSTHGCAYPRRYCIRIFPIISCLGSITFHLLHARLLFGPLWWLSNPSLPPQKFDPAETRECTKYVQKLQLNNHASI